MGSVTSRVFRSTQPVATSPLATGAQIREGRLLLRRGSAWLARRAGVDLRALIEVQSASGLAPTDPATIEFTLRSAQRALEAAGVEFIFESGSAARVRLRKST